MSIPKNTDVRPFTEHKKPQYIWYALFISLFFIFYGDFSAKMEYIANPNVVNNDARMQVAPFYSAINPELENDYTLQYMNYILPMGYKALYRAATPFIDPIVFSKVISVTLYFISLFLLTITAKKLEGMPGAFAVLAIALSASYFYIATAGGIPRNFGLPLLTAILGALVFGRMLFLGFITILGAAFYPMVGLMGGASLFGVLFILPKDDRGEAKNWSFFKRGAMVFAVGLVSIGLLLPNLAGKEFGRSLVQADCDTVPEIYGRGGSEWQCQSEFPPLWRQLVTTGRSAVRVSYKGEPWSPTLHNLASYHFRNNYGDMVRDDYITIILWGLIFIGVGSRISKKKESPLRRITLLFVISISGYQLSQILLPHLYFPERYTTAIPPLFLLLLPVAASGIFDIAKKHFSIINKETMRTGFIISLTIFCLLFLGGKAHRKQHGYDKNLSVYQTYYDQLKTLPKDAVIADWPKGRIESVTILTQRQAFIWKETHLPFNEIYVLNMRKRMFALIDAYFADSIAPLIKLRDEFGVDYLIIYKPYLKEVDAKYFAPFDEYSKKKKKAGRVKGFEVFRQIANAAVFDSPEQVTLDLKLIR
ncbi:MAG: hypothetical protein HQL71_01500 [Magnetococcales bacterium]|nr:hypothetical protein [Magnetococcales bacterium]